MSGSRTSFADWYDQGPHQQFVCERRLGGVELPVSLFDLKQPAGDLSDPAHTDLVIGTAIGSNSFRSVCSWGDGKKVFDGRMGHVYVSPPNAAVAIERDQPHRLLVASLPLHRARVLIERATGRELDDFGRLHEHPFPDPPSSALLRRIWADAGRRRSTTQLYVDGAMTMLLARLVELRDKGFKTKPTRKALDAVALSRITELLRNHLDGNVAVADLATLAGMRDYEFLRAFKTATGLAPYQYVLDLRLTRARDLLRTTTDPLAAVAYTCGFASQSHMTDVFRTKLGVTPGRYRREQRLVRS